MYICLIYIYIYISNDVYLIVHVLLYMSYIYVYVYVYIYNIYIYIDLSIGYQPLWGLMCLPRSPHELKKINWWFYIQWEYKNNLMIRNDGKSDKMMDGLGGATFLWKLPCTVCPFVCIYIYNMYMGLVGNRVYPPNYCVSIGNSGVHDFRPRDGAF